MRQTNNAQFPDFYELLGIDEITDTAGIKKAFREKAKLLHPDIAGKEAEDKMRLLITAYETLLDGNRRYAYDRIRTRAASARARGGFDYRSFLKGKKDNQKLQARLVFYDLLRGRSEEALSLWREHGALDWKMRQIMDREDWMDCAFLLSEELVKTGGAKDARELLLELLKAENEKPYFKHFTAELMELLKKCG